ncbi:thioredoxin family protein [Yinghuangia seranimata]|uniref:thioredoxin family protein n=1 Tax=Yinghuangia seranimata TaxID=408067 RepID=UPI00248CC7CA|nr:thioredoxin family protein [Yinghuangia seranimata]MDI2129444.1 thioredoxin family protein [Yinghuangia seranimata]
MTPSPSDLSSTTSTPSSTPPSKGSAATSKPPTTAGSSRTSAASSAPARPSTGRPQPPGAPLPSIGYDPKADSKAQIAAARAAAKADNRKVLLEFGADWCGNCVALDKTLHDPSVQAELVSAYHLVQIDADTHGDLLSQYAPSNSGGYGLPVIVILNPDGSTRVDTDKTGNPGLGVSSFLAFLKKWAA